MSKLGTALLGPRTIEFRGPPFKMSAIFLQFFFKVVFVVQKENSCQHSLCANMRETNLQYSHN